MAPVSRHREARILDLWERGVGRPGRARARSLLDGPASGDTLGACNAALIALRTALFGRRWPLRSRCPACGEDCAFDVDGAALGAHIAALTPARSTATIQWNGRQLAARAFTRADLDAVADCPDTASAIGALLLRCLSAPPDPAGLDAAAVATLGQALEALDPGAAIAFDVACPACAAPWAAPLDVAEALWSELERAAEQVFGEVDALARIYGWSEAAILRLSPLRRAAYLQLAEAS